MPAYIVRIADTNMLAGFYATPHRWHLSSPIDEEKDPSGRIGSKKSDLGIPDPVGTCESAGMRSGISFTPSSRDRQRLQAIVADPKSPQKHVWRARIVLLSGDGLGTSAIMAETGKSKTCVWRWQERFMNEGVDGLLRDRSRPPGKTPVPAERVAEIVRLTQEPRRSRRPTGRCARWPRWPALRHRRSRGSGRPTVSARTAGGSSSSPTTRRSPRNSRISSACTSIRPPMPGAVGR